MLRTLAIPLLLLAACKVDPLYCDENTRCTDPDRPFCDLNGDYPASDGVARTCIPDPNPGNEPDAGDTAGSDGNEPDAGQDPIACAEPGDALECDGDTLVSCSDAGTEQRVECPLGCSSEELRCLDLRPSNDVAPYLDQSAAADALVLTGVAEFNTDSGNLVDGDETTILARSVLVEAPSNGVPIRVLIASRVEIESLDVDGSAALAIAADGDVLIRGRLSVAGDDRVPGPGSFGDPSSCRGQRGTIGEANGRFHAGGNGGGGYRTKGAPGGTVEDEVAQNGAGGSPFFNSLLVPLRGGCPGGGSTNGGGAVQIVSRTRIDIAQDALINANGGGGVEPTPGPQFPDPGGGGGAGGAILLEAPEVTVAGGLFSNGGGGSAACGTGENGRESLDPALGKQCPGSDSGDGGSGGSALDGPTDGEPIAATSSFDNAGGSGGGAAGFIRINSRTGTFVPSPTALISPEPDVGTAATR